MYTLVNHNYWVSGVRGSSLHALVFLMLEKIRIYHEFVDRIDTSVHRVTV